MLPGWKQLLVSAVLVVAAATVTGCGSDGGGVVEPGHNTGQEYWWDNYLDASREPITLSSGFKLYALDGSSVTATRYTSTSAGMSLNFRIDPDWRSTRGWLFRGDDQNNTSLATLAGAAEVIKSNGWLTIGETFDWESTREDGNFNFTLYNRFTQFPIRSPFSGFATDLMTTLLSEPYIAFPTDTTKTWQGPVTNVSDGNSEFQEIMTYSIDYLGTRQPERERFNCRHLGRRYKDHRCGQPGPGTYSSLSGTERGYHLLLLHHRIRPESRRRSGRLQRAELHNRRRGNHRLLPHRWRQPLDIRVLAGRQRGRLPFQRGVVSASHICIF